MYPFRVTFFHMVLPCVPAGIRSLGLPETQSPSSSYHLVGCRCQTYSITTPLLVLRDKIKCASTAQWFTKPLVKWISAAPCCVPLEWRGKEGEGMGGKGREGARATVLFKSLPESILTKPGLLRIVSVICSLGLQNQYH